MLAFIELVVFFSALVVRGDPTHFTWWGVAIFTLSLAAAVAPVARHVKYRAAVATVASGVVVMVAVVGMSVAECTMLGEALDGIGPWAYFTGNFALHYYPALRGITLCDRAGNANNKCYFDAPLALAAYCVLQRPTSIYGCAFSTDWLVTLAGVAGCAGTEVVASRWASSR